MTHRSQFSKDSSQSDDDEEIFWKKRTSSEVKRTAVPCDNETSPNQSQKARRNIWLNVLNENKLNEALSKVNVQANVNLRTCLDTRLVYSDPVSNTDVRSVRKRNRRRYYNRNLPSKKRVCESHWDKSVFSTHSRVNPNDSTNSVKHALVKLLKEPNEELISQVVHILGVKRTLEFYFLTEEIEKAGGLHTACATDQVGISQTLGMKCLLAVRLNTGCFK
ncbi:hypothetical protein PHET_10906 [Paragonimus heterotremus]|uniref:Phosphorylated adapter RNA export protein n=1 Tax=Paragonimus heterotremus TaxID=100268 RepID=A0A8J4WMT4_9TREM|nr:hypothetical protein PHET_10906 [Paragonimus heterotremus]